MKFILKTVILLLLAAITLSASAKKDPEIRLSASLTGISETSCTIDYNALISGIDSSAFKEQTLFYPFEESIIEGMFIDGKVNERDFLFSERNIDLNNDGDLDDSFSVSFRGGEPVIAGKKTGCIYMKKSGRTMIIPFDRNNRENSVSVTDKGVPFTIHSFDYLAGRLTAGIGKQDSPLFRSSGNGIIMVEIISKSDENSGEITINGLKPDAGFTNEKIFSPGGENLKRLFTVLNSPPDNNACYGTVKISGTRNFTVRLRYLFAVSSRIVLMDEKILIHKTQ